MKNILSGISDLARRAGEGLKGAFRTAGKNINRSAARGRTYAGGRQQQGPTPVLGAPGTPIRSSAASNQSTAHNKAQQSGKKVFGRRVAVKSKKRLVVMGSAVIAAVLVPVIAVSAVTGGTFVSHGVSVVAPAVTAGDRTHTETLGAHAQAEILDKAPVVEASGPMTVSAQETGTVAFSGEGSGNGEDPQTAEAAVTPQSEEGGQAAESSGEASVEPEPTPTEDPMSKLAPGITDDAVIDLQRRLMELHYMENDEPTNYYGSQTQQAVAYFQRKHGMAVDGYAGPETQAVLFSDDAKVYTVSEGAEGDDVWTIQERLENLGYPVAVTGYYGTTTTSAVQYFQRMNGLTDDGTVGQDTKDILFSEQAERAIPPEPDPVPEDNSGSSGDGESSGGESSGGGSSDESGGSSGGDSSDEDNSGSGSSSSDDEEDNSGSSGGGGGSAPAANPGSVSAFIDAACAQEGKPYVLGGKGPNVFDCSGLVYYALNASGNSIGYMTSGGWASSGYPTISWDNLQPGDVVCMTGHVAVYLGDGMMCDASSSNGRIMIRSMGNWARSNFICGKRPL